MNHQVQTSVLVNNEWVSRPVDAYQFMAQARESDGDMPKSTAKPRNQVPELGILSRTVFASPLFKSVRPANVRSKDLNDIVLIGEDAVQLKEIHDYGRLRHVATKSDFKGRILAARVFGDPREIPVSVASPLPKQRPWHQGRRSTTGEEECVLPPEVLVLALTNRTLMFLWARHTRKGAVTFSQRAVRLPAGASQFDRFGTFLAIDPKQRAMAVAAQEGRFILYKTKSMQKWRKELRNGMDTTPIEDERIMPIEGRVMHMEFLSSGLAQDEFHVVLLFVIALQGKTKMTCFDWDCRQDLSTAAVRTERVAVDYHDHNPSLLIPLSRTSDFILVFDTHVTLYKDVLSGVPRRLEIPIAPEIIPSLLPGDSKRRPRWVEWDKTPRNPDFPKEAFYVAREDGRIMYLERGPTGVDTVEAGDWPHHIDTAFACLSVDNSEYSQLYPDVLIAGGAGNDGRLCKLGSWPAEYSYASYPVSNELSYVDSISNWTPLTDLSVASPSGGPMPQGRDRYSIFVANGSSPHGEISELRRGVRSLIDHSFSGMTGCTGIWVVDHGSQTLDIDGRVARQHYALLIITMPPETLLIRIVRTQSEIRGDFSGAWEDGAWKVDQIPNDDEPTEDGVMRDMETITACPWTEKLAIQITRDEVRVLHRPSLQKSDLFSCTSSILLAACRPGFPFVAITFRESGRTYLEVLCISSDGIFVKTASQHSRFLLDHDPTCIELFEVDGTMCVLVGTFGSTIYFLKVDENGDLHAMLNDSLKSAENDEIRMILESASLLSTKEQQTLVCATRNGYLLSSRLPKTKSNATHLSWHVVKMGTTSAKITASATDTSTAFVSCGPDLCRVRCSASNPSMLDVDSLWFTSRFRPGYQQSAVTALYQLPFSNDNKTTGRNLGGFMFVVAGDEFHCSQLDTDIRWTAQDASPLSRDDSGPVPRKLLTGARPTNVTYLKPTRKMVVTTMEAKEGEAPPNGYRVLHSAIKLLDVHDHKAVEEAEIKQEDQHEYANKLVAAQYKLKHGERVYSIAEWLFVDPGNRKFNFIIVGTGIPGSAGKETGRRLVFNVGKNEPAAKLELKKYSSFGYPVYCTAAYSNTQIVSAIGKNLTLDSFDCDTGVFRKCTAIDLPSAAIHITIRDKYVHVSTLQHSHLCYIIDESNGKPEFKRLFSDSRERNCSTHLVVDIPNLSGQDTIVLVNDKKSSSVTGLHRTTTKTHKFATPTLFEACLPRTVVRIQQGNIRPPWRRPAAPTIGVLNNDIIGACSDGTIYTFSILSQPARHLLRFLQNLIEEKDKRDPMNHVTGSLSDVLMHGADGNQEDKIRALDVDPRVKERGMAGPRFKAIDGDLVGRWMDVDGDLEALVGEGTEANVGRIFAEFVAEVWEDEMDAMGKVRGWLAEVFMPVL
ncbi:hypothetical protein HBI39_196210 [Parastagonospora nodorum]|nr:hypothetical protein HBI12_059160 [Parastagonospora nodorum]KAH6290792.1 hypothetical protein HBI39_196210 [Parastagonospora nodorum]